MAASARAPLPATSKEIPSGFGDAEIQVLSSLARAEAEALPSARADLEQGGERFWIFKTDWTEAFKALAASGLIEGDDSGYRLTDAGRPLAVAWHAERPDMYWYYYRQFYPAACASAAHTRLCERVFGLDLTQEGMCDMPALHHLMQVLSIGPGDHVLDLGCGAGVIAEYIADKTGSRVTGLDYAAPCIAEARDRTKAKSSLAFVQGDMNALDLPDRSFDKIMCIDTLYWVSDLTDTVTQIARLVKPGGEIGIFMLHHVPDGRAAADFSAAETTLGKALLGLGLDFEAHDYTVQNAAFWHRNYNAAKDLRGEFEGEGNGWIAASLIRESEEDFLPPIKAGTLVRYLYHVRA
jgi:SAM-dependent methyltransferase